MEKEQSTFSTLSSSISSVSHTDKSFSLNNSLFSPTPSTTLLESVENFKPHNPYMKRPNHMIIKMFGKINGEPITHQSSYLLNTNQVSGVGSRTQMEKLESENKELQLKVKALEETVTRLSSQKKKNSALEDKENRVSLKLAEKQHQYSLLADSHSRQRQFSLSLQTQIKQHREEMLKLKHQLSTSKEQTAKSNSLLASLKKENQQLVSYLQLQKQENLKLKIASAHQKTLQKQLESVSGQMLVLKETNNKLSRENQGLRVSVAEKKEASGGSGDYSSLQEYVRKLEEKVRKNQRMIDNSNEEIMKARLEALNERLGRGLH